ncbi:MAG: Lactate utilization protein A [Accumulibacter sp.]|uniref:glycolate oxidase subunit GlcF n=1 Tax=Accumulibacter sp. TaxID=2053492 RepID=UPI001208F3E8|nr:glycolate oxidase subunit GlcF [Accumulibacter sp.]QKS30738.1 MAG: glycolate oxidase subunit GlcF [Candidatus Accumulibacter similis]TLD46464.1 MAG: Lactate utilization protein A [Accumulibacter sp.]
MQTNLADFIRDTPAGREADAILRSCVHCGFCTATCPTFQLLGDELDGPRGRIYLIKQMLEGEPVSKTTQVHLDRCLSCRSCETTCPSGVRYHRLLEIGREVVEQKVPRSLAARATRFLLCEALPRNWIFRPAVRVGQMMRPLLPRVLAEKVPPAAPGGARPWPRAAGHRRRMIALAGCVQPTLTPNTNAATARVLDRLGIELVEMPAAACCGALRYHLHAQEKALDDMRQVIDAWWPEVESGRVEAFVMTASGCGEHVRAYGELLQHDPAYAAKAARIARMTRDASEVLAGERERLVELLRAAGGGGDQRVAFHSPCTLQHAQKIRGVVESLLAAAGFQLSAVADPHLCCGSAGTYSISQPVLATQLRDNKLAAMNAGGPAFLVTANIGCQTHLQSGSALPVRHWIELIDECLGTAS